MIIKMELVQEYVWVSISMHNVWMALSQSGYVNALDLEWNGLCFYSNQHFNLKNSNVSNEISVAALKST